LKTLDERQTDKVTSITRSCVHAEGLLLLMDYR